MPKLTLIHCQCKNSRIPETPNLLSDADRSTNTKIKLFLGGGDIRTEVRTNGRTYGQTKGRGGHISHVTISPVACQCSAMQCNLQYSVVQHCSRLIHQKLDGVGPVDNTNRHLTWDTRHVTHSGE